MRRCARVRTATSPRVILSLLAAVLIAAYGATAHAQSSDRVGMSFKAPEGEFTVGEVVPLTLEATYPTGFQVILPVLPRSWGAFEVRSQSPAVVEDRDDGSSSISQTIEIVLFAPGEHSTPELLVTVRDPSGKMTDIAAPMATVNIVSVLGEDDLDLRDIRPQEAPPLSLPPLWPWFAVPLCPHRGGGRRRLLHRRAPPGGRIRGGAVRRSAVAL